MKWKTTDGRNKPVVKFLEGKYVGDLAECQFTSECADLNYRHNFHFQFNGLVMVVF
jgi:hypothetical protein